MLAFHRTHCLLSVNLQLEQLGLHCGKSDVPSSKQKLELCHHSALLHACLFIFFENYAKCVVKNLSQFLFKYFTHWIREELLRCEYPIAREPIAFGSSSRHTKAFALNREVSTTGWSCVPLSVCVSQEDNKV